MLFTLKYTLSFDFTKNIPVLVRNEKQSSLSSRSLLSGRGQVWLVVSGSKQVSRPHKTQEKKACEVGNNSVWDLWACRRETMGCDTG